MNTKYLFLLAGLVSGMNAVAAEIAIQCERGTGTAEVMSEHGGSAFRTNATDGPFEVSLLAREAFIWGHATGGGWLGEHIEPGAVVTLTETNEIRLQQGSEFYGEQTSDQIVPDGVYSFSTYNGLSITCDLRVNN